MQFYKVSHPYEDGSPGEYGRIIAVVNGDPVAIHHFACGPHDVMVCPHCGHVDSDWHPCYGWLVDDSATSEQVLHETGGRPVSSDWQAGRLLTGDEEQAARAVMRRGAFVELSVIPADWLEMEE